MNNRMKMIIVLGVIAGAAVLGCMNGYFGQNDDQDWQVLQGLGGKMSVRTDSGIYQKKFASAWTYPKVQKVYFSSDVREGSAQDDSCKVVFSDKGTASFSTMVLYRSPYMLAGLSIPDIDANGKQPKGLKEGAVANFHRLCKGDIRIADSTVLARIKEYSRITASGYNASQAVDNQAEFIAAIRTALKNDKTLIAYGIDVEDVMLSDIVFDDPTLIQFTIQQTAILASKNAEAKKVQFDMEKLETEADYAKQIAKVKGEAEKTMMTQVTDAKRDKELAEIKAEKLVRVAEFTKQEADIVASKKLSVAVIAKKTLLMEASAKFEQAEIMAVTAVEKKKAMIAEAEGRKEAIELSGAITELEQAQIQAEVDKAKYVAEALAKINVPQTMIFAGGESGGSVTEQLINIRLMEASSLFDKIDVNKTTVNRKVRPTKK